MFLGVLDFALSTLHGSLNEKHPPQAWVFETWYWVVGTVWGGLGGAVRLEEIHLPKQSFQVPLPALCLWLRV